MPFGLSGARGGGYSHTGPDGMCCSTGCPFAVKIMRQGIAIGKKIMQGIMKKGKLCDRVSQAKILFLVCFWDAKFLCDRVYLWLIFYATGCRVRRGFPHTPFIFLVKSPWGSSLPQSKVARPGTKSRKQHYPSCNNLLPKLKPKTWKFANLYRTTNDLDTKRTFKDTKPVLALR